MSAAAIPNCESRKRRKERGGKAYRKYLLKDAERKRVTYRTQQELPEEERQRRRVGWKLDKRGQRATEPKPTPPAPKSKTKTKTAQSHMTLRPRKK